MNKGDLITRIAEEAGLTKAKAGEALDAALKVISETLKDGGEVSIIGFGKFHVQERAARSGHNPATGQPITIPAKRVPKFKPGAVLKETVEG